MRTYSRTSNPVCECDHKASLHQTGGGACAHKDSYGDRCSCKWFVEDEYQDG